MADKQLIIVGAVAVAAVGAACLGVYASTSRHEPRPATSPVVVPGGGGGARPGPLAVQKRVAPPPLSVEEKAQLVAALEARAESLAYSTPEIAALGAAASTSFGPSLRAVLERMLGASVNIDGADAPGGMLGNMRIDVDRVTVSPYSKDDDSIGVMLNRNAATSASGRPIPGTTSVEAAEARRRAEESGEGQARQRMVMSFRTEEAADVKGPIMRVKAPLLTGEDEPAREEGVPEPMVAIDLAWDAEKREWVQAGTTITGTPGMMRPGGMPVRMRAGGTVEERVTN